MTQWQPDHQTGQTEAWLGSKVKALEAWQTHTTVVLVTESIVAGVLGDLDEELYVRILYV